MTTEPELPEVGADQHPEPRSSYELARNRRIPFLKVGRRTLFEAHSLQDWIAEQTVQPR